MLHPYPTKYILRQPNLVGGDKNGHDIDNLAKFISHSIMHVATFIILAFFVSHLSYLVPHCHWMKTTVLVDDSLLYLASQDCSLFSFLTRVKFPLFFFWVSQGRPIFSKGASSDSSIFPSLWFLTGKEWYRGRVCWVGFKLSLLYFPLPMVPYGAGVTEGWHLLGGFWVKFALSQFRFLYLHLSKFI